MTRPPRVGIIRWSDRSSRRTTGLVAGLEDCGAEVVVCDVEAWRGVPRVVHRWLRAVGRLDQGWTYSREMMTGRELSARWRSWKLRPVDGWVVIGSDMGVPVRGRFVTFEDMTVVQAFRHNFFPSFPERTATYWRANQARLYARATRCCAASAWAATSITRDYGIDQTKVEVVGLGRNLMVPPSDRDWSKPRYLFVGRDWERKNGPAVLEAFSRIRAGGICDAELAVVGAHPPLEVAGVHGYGPLNYDRPSERSMLVNLFQSSTCLVLPSTIEPYGIVYAEAAAAGLPSIGTTVGGAGEAIGPAGLTVEPDDRAGLMAAMVRMADPDVARRYGASGPGHAASLTWQRVAARIIGALGIAPQNSRSAERV